MRISDWSSDVCSSDLIEGPQQRQDSQRLLHRPALIGIDHEGRLAAEQRAQAAQAALVALLAEAHLQLEGAVTLVQLRADQALGAFRIDAARIDRHSAVRVVFGAAIEQPPDVQAGTARAIGTPSCWDKGCQ